jgi:hypothetical protein
MPDSTSSVRDVANEVIGNNKVVPGKEAPVSSRNTKNTATVVVNNETPATKNITKRNNTSKKTNDVCNVDEASKSNRKRKKNASAVVNNETPTAKKKSKSNYTSKKTLEICSIDDAVPKQNTSSTSKNKSSSRSRKQSKSSKKNIAKHIAKCANVNVVTSSYFSGIEVSDTIFMPAENGKVQVEEKYVQMEVDVPQPTDAAASIMVVDGSMEQPANTVNVSKIDVATKKNDMVIVRSTDDRDMNGMTTAMEDVEVLQTSHETNIDGFLGRNALPVVATGDSPAPFLGETSVEAFIDVVDLSDKTYCGYNFILRIVDPKARYGHAIAMKSNTEVDCTAAIQSLLSVARMKPSTIFYDHRTSFVLKLGEKYPSINFSCLSQNDSVIENHKNYLELIHKWIEDTHRDFLTGATVVQAVLNNMPKYVSK